MITVTDLDAAVDSWLSSIPGHLIEEAAGTVYRESLGAHHAPSADNRMASILGSLNITSERRARPVWNALLAKGAQSAGDRDCFYQAAFSAFDSRRQRDRAAKGRASDALDGLIRAAIAEFPDFGPALLWAEFSHRASVAGDGVLADYDGLADLISFEPSPGADLREIGFEAFRRRVQRLRKKSCAT